MRFWAFTKFYKSFKLALSLILNFIYKYVKREVVGAKTHPNISKVSFLIYFEILLSIAIHNKMPVALAEI